MVRYLMGFALLALACLPVTAAAQATMGYDAYGRLTCVYHPASTPKITKYVYDAAGNRTQRTVAAASGQTCTSQAVGPPPTLPVQLTALNPSAPLTSAGSTSFPMTALGTASDASTLTVVSATTTGGSGSCGTASTTASTIGYSAPVVNPASVTLVCYIDYVFSHTNGQQKTGRATITIQGVDPEGGGGGGGEPCVPNPQTGLCEIE